MFRFSFSSGRYIILLMGAFSMYTGLMYNDIFSKSLHLWPSAWTFPVTNGTVVGVLNENRYPFGLDPGWHGSVNALVFSNSYKMKMSIVLGVIHVRSPLGRRFVCANVMFVVDDVCSVFASSQPPQIQTLLGFIHQLHSSNYFLAVHFRIPRSMHPVQMVCRLVDIANSTAIAAEHVDYDVFAARLCACAIANVPRTRHYSIGVDNDCSYLRALVVDFQALSLMEGNAQNSN